MSSFLKLLGAAALAGALLGGGAAAQDGAKLKPVPAPPPERAADSEIARYCAALAPSEAEARAANQLRRLAALQQQVRDEVEKLEIKQSAAREWVTQRNAMVKSASDDVVAIYAKMAPDAAASQLSAMDEGMAAAVLLKLKPTVASAILAEMAPDKAAKLSTLVAGALGAEHS